MAEETSGRRQQPAGGAAGDARRVLGQAARRQRGRQRGRLHRAGPRGLCAAGTGPVQVTRYTQRFSRLCTHPARTEHHETLSAAWEQVLVFLNSFLLLNDGNRLAVFAMHSSDRRAPGALDHTHSAPARLCRQLANRAARAAATCCTCRRRCWARRGGARRPARAARPRRACCSACACSWPTTSGAPARPRTRCWPTLAGLERACLRQVVGLSHHTKASTFM